MSSEAARPTQAERRATSEARLLRAAAELIVERGIEGTSLAEIGRRAGASHALVNHRFGSKDALVDRLGLAANDLYARHAGPVVEGASGIDALLGLADVYLDLVCGDDPVARVHVVLWSEAVAHSSGRGPVHAAWDRRFRRVVAAMVADGIADGSIPSDVVPDDAAFALVGMLRGVAMQLLLDPELGGSTRPAVRGLMQRSLLGGAFGGQADGTVS